MNRNKEQLKEKVEELRKQAADLGVTIDISENDFYEYCQHCCWYGGNIATITYGQYTIYIEANGDIYGELYDENGEYITCVKDKSNSGNFYHEMHSYIKNDEELIQYLGWDYDVTSDVEPRLHMENNNWIEISVYDNRDSRWLYNADTVCDEDDVLDIDIASILEMVDEIIKDWT